MPSEAEAIVLSPRCLHPMEWREMNSPRDDFPAVCWRPAGHPGPGRHLSRYAVMNERRRGRESKRKARARGRQARTRQELAA